MKRTVNNEKNPGNIIMEIGILLIIANLLCAVEVWQAIIQGWKVVGSNGFFANAFIRAGEQIAIFPIERNQCYLAFLRFLFSFLGNQEFVVLFGNIVLQFLGVAFFYRGARAFAGVIWSLVVAAATAMTSVLCYSITNDNSIHIIWFFTAFVFYVLSKIYCSGHGNISFWRLIRFLGAGAITGVLFYIDLSAVTLLVLLIIFIVFLHTVENTIKIWYFFVTLLGTIGSFFSLLYVEYGYFLDNPVSILLHWYHVRLALLIDTKVFYPYILFIPFFIWIYVLIIVKSISNKKLDENVDPVKKEEIKENTNPEWGETEKSQENVMKEEPDVPKVKLLENPLPLPKKHVKKELNYAFEPKPSQMHYDLNNYNVNDDYDLK